MDKIFQLIFRAIIYGYGHAACFRFPLYCTFSKPRSFKGGWGQKTEAKFRSLFTPSPVKIRGGVCKISEWIIRAIHRTQSLIYFWPGAAGLSRRVEGGCSQKSPEAKFKDHADIRRAALKSSATFIAKALRHSYVGRPKMSFSLTMTPADDHGPVTLYTYRLTQQGVDTYD